jgi:hypothetical protein
MLCYLDDKTSVATQYKWTHIRQTAPASKTAGMREATTDGRRNRGPHGEPGPLKAGRQHLITDVEVFISPVATGSLPTLETCFSNCHQLLAQG